MVRSARYWHWRHRRHCQDAVTALRSGCSPAPGSLVLSEGELGNPWESGDLLLESDETKGTVRALSAERSLVLVPSV